MASPIRGNQLSLESIKSIIKKYNPEWVNLSGGEPVLYPWLTELIFWLQENGIKCKLYTCGNIKKESLPLNADKIILSFNCHEKKIFNFITQNSYSYDKTIETINFLNANNKPFEAHIVPMTMNVLHLENTIDTLIKLNVKKIGFLKLVNQGRCKDNQFLILKSHSEVYRLKEMYGDLIRLGSPYNNVIPCVAGIEKLVVKASGEIIPCESFKDGTNNCQRVINEPENCPVCGSDEIYYENPRTGYGGYVCDDCGYKFQKVSQL